MPSELLEVQGLSHRFRIKRRVGLLSRASFLQAVDRAYFGVDTGDAMGLVGESGCGKTTVARLLTGILRAPVGSVFLEGRDVAALRSAQWRRARRDIQMIFQDPLGSLDPRKRVGYQILEPLVIHNIGNPTERKRKCEQMMEAVSFPFDFLGRFPHELSGGQQQRVAILRALMLDPKLLVCDEPISSLDVSIQAQVINLLLDLQQQFDLAYVFITHDLRVVRHMCRHVAIMYLGQIVEAGITEEAFEYPAHPYTEALLSAIPNPNPRAQRRRLVLEGDPPSPIDLPKGCRFESRCHRAMPICTTMEPETIRVGDREHVAACHLVSQTTDSNATPDADEDRFGSGPVHDS